MAGLSLVLLLLVPFASAHHGQWWEHQLGWWLRNPVTQQAGWRCRPPLSIGWGCGNCGGQVSGGGKVRVDVYFESLCSDSMRFFTNQLYPTWTQLHDIMDLHLIPWGKAKATPTGNGDFTFECQHGANECHGNKVMSCVQNSFPIDTQVKMIHCMMSQNYPAFAGPQCAGQVGVDWAPLESCSRSTVGSNLLYQNGVKTAALKPRVYFIPTITIDGQYSHDQLQTSLRSLKSQVCQFYKGPPHQNCL